MGDVFGDGGKQLVCRNDLDTVIKLTDEICKVIRTNRPGVNVDYGITVYGFNIGRLCIYDCRLLCKPLIVDFIYISAGMPEAETDGYKGLVIRNGKKVVNK